MLGIFNSSSSFGQESTTYFFLGNIYSLGENGKEVRYPYLPVAMAKKEAPQKIIAVSVTNAAGVISFEGIPIDITKGYIFTISLPSGTKKFLFSGINNPSFKGGNVSIHMKLDRPEEYLKTNVFKPEKKDYGDYAIDFATAKIQGATRRGATITSKNGLNYRIYMKGRPVRGRKMTEALENIPAEALEKIIITHPILENDFFAGTIDFVTTAGKNTDSESTTYTLPRL